MKRIVFSPAVLLLHMGLTGAVTRTYPFRIIHRSSLLIQYPCNDTLRNFLLDTGGPYNFIDSVFAGSLQWSFSKRAVTIHAPGGAIRAYPCLSGFVPFPAANWYVLNLKALSRKLHVPVVGIVGNSLFFRNAVLLDFEKRQMTVTNRKLTGKLLAGYKRVRIQKSRDPDQSDGHGTKIPCMEGKVRPGAHGSVPAKFFIDTGNTFEFSLLVSDSSILNRISVDTTKYVNVYGAKITVRYTRARIGIAELGIDSLKKALIFHMDSPGFKATFGDAKLGVSVGLPFLLRYRRVIFNWPGNTVFVK